MGWSHFSLTKTTRHPVSQKSGSTEVRKLLSAIQNDQLKNPPAPDALASKFARGCHGRARLTWGLLMVHGPDIAQP